MALKGWNSCGRAEFTKTRPISQFTSFCSGVHERFKRAMPIAIRVAERAKIISASISMNLCPFSAPVAAYRVHSVTPYPRRLGRFCVALLAFAVPVPDFGEGYHPFGSTRAAGMSGRAAPAGVVDLGLLAPAFSWKRPTFQCRLSWSSSAQTSTSSKSPGDVLAISVITFCRQARLTRQDLQAQPSAWGGPSRLAKISK